MIKFIHLASCLSTKAFYMKQSTASNEGQIDSDRIVAQIHGEQTTGLQPLLEGNEPLLHGLPRHMTKRCITTLYQLQIWHALLPLHHVNEVFHLKRFSSPHIDGTKTTETVVNSSSGPNAKPHKRHDALSFHRVREAIASNMPSFLHIKGAKNQADILSKRYQQAWPQLRTLLL